MLRHAFILCLRPLTVCFLNRDGRSALCSVSLRKNDQNCRHYTTILQTFLPVLGSSGIPCVEELFVCREKNKGLTETPVKYLVRVEGDMILM